MQASRVIGHLEATAYYPHLAAWGGSYTRSRPRKPRAA